MTQQSHGDDAKEYYLSLSDEELFLNFRNKPHRLGDFCYVQVSAPSSSNACQFYVKAESSDITTYNGWPRTFESDQGTGCVKNDDSSFCYFKDHRYSLSQNERNTMCTDSAQSNAAAQLRHAIHHNACGTLLIPNTAIVGGTENGTNQITPVSPTSSSSRSWDSCQGNSRSDCFWMRFGFICIIVVCLLIVCRCAFTLRQYHKHLADRRYEASATGTSKGKDEASVGSDTAASSIVEAV
uniref:Uncharacterized protein n=1 Tax=Craspedostauros australis TaxID=1486917 RepID=A0A7S0F569_9STRA|mmetsp:Transcript_6314/g.17160  ORF Transcript_6314/g.17160 Transcript_6314/m.17160 type:complete len:239 (+) Transcript_6314:598-1314(+)